MLQIFVFASRKLHKKLNKLQLFLCYGHKWNQENLQDFKLNFFENCWRGLVDFEHTL